MRARERVRVVKVNRAPRGVGEFLGESDEARAAFEVVGGRAFERHGDENLHR
jgi:hypothetical protein